MSGRDEEAHVLRPWGSQATVRPPGRMTDQAREARRVWLASWAERLRFARRGVYGVNP